MNNQLTALNYEIISSSQAIQIDSSLTHRNEAEYQHSSTLDTTLGSLLLILSILGTAFNLIVVLSVRVVTKKNCSKARLASSILIFNLSLSETLYSTVHMFSAITMLVGGRDPEQGGLPDNIPTRVLCNITGVFLKLTMRTSLWFLTMLTVIRYLSVMFPLKLPLLVTKRRIKAAALAVWAVIFVLPLVPFAMNRTYKYSRPLSICIWHVTHDQGFQAQVAIHLILMVVPIILPGILIITLYLQIVWKVIQLKTVHYKLRSGKIAKKVERAEDVEDDEDNDMDLVEKEPPNPASTSNSRRKKISLAFSSWSSSISFLNRPLSIIELERIEKETECIDQDLMNLTVTSLSKDTFNRQNSDRSGVVAYYINRFIVKTAGNATFERIQSNSFSDTRRSVDYEAEECPISLNYYDCKEFPDITSNSWSLKRGTSCDEVIPEAEDNKNLSRFRRASRAVAGSVQRQDSELQSPPARVDMATVVTQAMKKFLNKDLKDVKVMGNGENSPKLNKIGSSKSLNNKIISTSPPNSIDKPATIRRMSSIKEVAARCRSNSILEESTTNSNLSPRIVCVNGVCKEVSVNTTPSPRSFRVTESPSSSFRVNTSSIKEETDPLSEIQSENLDLNHSTHHPPVSKATSLPDKLLSKEIAVSETLPVKNKQTQSTPAVITGSQPPPLKTKLSFKKKILNHLKESANGRSKTNILQEKRINRLDMRLRVIIQSAFYTLLMVTLFVICYMPWWLLSIDILFRLVGTSPMLNVDFTWYCNFLTLSYSTILLSACSNPVIYFYFAYKQAMLDTLKLKYKRFAKGKMQRFLKSKKKRTRGDLCKDKNAS